LRLKAGPFFKRKELWVPTWKGSLLLVGTFVAVCIFLIKEIPYFLAPNAPINARVLVVEGWIDEVGIEATKALEEKNHYDLVLCSGGRIERGFDEVTYGTFANLGATRLRAMGYSSTNLVAVPSSDSPKDRTFHSAQAVRAYLMKTPYRSVDLLSGHVHTRRSWLMYRRALGPEFKVGVYAVPPTEFQMNRWYRKSSGVRNVMSETIAYLYARFIFRPAAFESPPGIRGSPAIPAASPGSTNPLPEH
jgi:hypothetical protein